MVSIFVVKGVDFDTRPQTSSSSVLLRLLLFLEPLFRALVRFVSFIPILLFSVEVRCLNPFLAAAIETNERITAIKAT